ncbi:uncharacterized protein L201_002570 [Kwoniella dendrophila CBS 6074]|uniref:C3H1-type domain-containing protein n=1 Tax=Kwoniella dendrophila CBS 6074 TaxID=1295534 RepID=A0AAX4JS05_9TREE
MSSQSTSPAAAPATPLTPSPTSPNFKLTLPTPPSFSAHRSRSADSSRATSSTNLNDLISQSQSKDNIDSTSPVKQSKRLSISSIHDPIVDDNERKDRRVSFSIETHTISRPPSGLGDSGLKSPVYRIPQRQTDDNDKEEILESPDIKNDLPSTPQSSNKRRPISFQGLSSTSSFSALGSPNNTSPSRFSTMAASKGISIQSSLSKGGAFSKSIWSAGIIPNSNSGWISPNNDNRPLKSLSPSLENTMKSISLALKSPINTTTSIKSSNNILKSPNSTSMTTKTTGTAAEIAKARGLSIAIIKENGKGVVVPITPGLSSSNNLGANGMKSPIIFNALKSPEIKILTGYAISEGALQSAKSIGVPDTPGSASKKEIILCKFYHTPGLTCTSRPCRFVHNLSSIQQQQQQPNSGVVNLNTSSLLSGYKMLSNPSPPDPTSGTFAHAQMTPSIEKTNDDNSFLPKKTLKMNENGKNGMDLGDIMPGEKVLIEDENGDSVLGQIYFMSGGGKGAMGKSREKWKTVPCKDFAEGHCPYGDYCSFLHDEKASTATENTTSKIEQKVSDDTDKSSQPRRLTHRKSASLSSSLTAWTRSLPKAILVPSVKVDPKVLQKSEGNLSAFAPAFTKNPVSVDETGDIVPALSSPVPLHQLPVFQDQIRNSAATPPERIKEPLAIPMTPTITAPPKVNTAWSKGPPPNLRKVASIKNNLTLSMLNKKTQNTDDEHFVENANENGGGLTPTSATGNNYLMPPVSAISMFGTDSDPASPFDPVVQRRKLQELEDSLKDLPKSNLSYQFEYDLQQSQYQHQYPHQHYSQLQTESQSQSQYDYQAPSLSSVIQQQQHHHNVASTQSTENNSPSNIFNSGTYPWGMPMSPLPGYKDPSVPIIPGGLGVIWTPAGWAVQDAAMKNALRSAEVKAKYGEDIKRRTAKNYFRTKPCKFYAEGFCPHGDECTYMHVLTPSSSEQSTSTSTSSSSEGSESGTFSPIQLNSILQQTPHPPHPKHQTLPCKFYNSSLGCNNGSKCNFLHTRVVPESVNLVERPRPWRTKPCRHYQLGRCNLGDACHFAHVLDPAWINSGLQNNVNGNNNNYNDNINQNQENSLTEEMLEKTIEEMRKNHTPFNNDDEDDDDVEIVTAVGDMTFSSSSYSPPSSVRA